jgi:hypothetical protein
LWCFRISENEIEAPGAAFSEHWRDTGRIFRTWWRC